MKRNLKIYWNESNNDFTVFENAQLGWKKVATFSSCHEAESYVFNITRAVAQYLDEIPEVAA